MVVDRDAAVLTTYDDGTLARAVASTPAGDARDAEGELYRRFAPRVRLFGLKYLRDRGAADDLAQQVMLLVIERLRGGEVQNPDQIGSFVLGTCRMMIAGSRRTERRRQALHVRFDSREQAVDAVREDSLDAARLGPCLASLSERDRSVVLLSYYAERTADDIGRSLGMSAGAVRVCRHRALAALRTCVDSRRTS